MIVILTIIVRPLLAPTISPAGQAIIALNIQVALLITACVMVQAPVIPRWLILAVGLVIHQLVVEVLPVKKPV